MIDAHCHLQNFSVPGRSEQLQTAKNLAISHIVCSSTKPADWENVATIAKENNFVIPTFGIHPWFADLQTPWESSLKKYLDGDRAVVLKDSSFPSNHSFLPGVGEIGLDFAKNHEQTRRAIDRDIQEYFFAKQLAIARERNRPIIVHSVRANDRVIAMIHREGPFPLILFHGLRATTQEVKKMLDLGGFISVSFRDIFEQHRRWIDMVASIPADRLLPESDAPAIIRSLTESVGGKSAFPERKNCIAGMELLPKAMEVIATIRGEAIGLFLNQLRENEEQFLDKWPRIRTISPSRTDVGERCD